MASASHGRVLKGYGRRNWSRSSSERYQYCTHQHQEDYFEKGLSILLIDSLHELPNHQWNTLYPLDLLLCSNKLTLQAPAIIHTVSIEFPGLAESKEFTFAHP